MLPPWMIEQLERARRERQDRDAQQRPSLQIEIQRPDERPAPADPGADDGQPATSRVVVIQLW